jgi:TolA-binding protein
MARISRKELKKDEFVEAAFDLQHWLEHNWPTVVKIAVPILVAGLIVGAWFWHANRVQRQSQDLLGQGMHQYRQAEADGFVDMDRLGDSLDLFEQAAERAGGSTVGQVARYYRGVTLYRLSRVEEAIAALESVELGREDSPSLGAAKALLADLLVESGKVEQAVAMLNELADQPETSYPPDLALLHLGRIQKAQGNIEEARQSWSRIVEEYPESAAAQQASRLLGS